MFNSVVEKTSRLSLGPSYRVIQQPFQKSMFANFATSDTDTDFVSEGPTVANQSETSRRAVSDDDFWSTGVSHADTASRGSVVQVLSQPTPGCSRDDLLSTLFYPTASSPDRQTLTDLKLDAIKDKGKSRTNITVRPKPKRSRRAVWKSSKIMCEEMFEGVTWTRLFVSGLMDPRWNPYKFYCQSCKGNISIHVRGAKKILHHHSTERHLRKDQRRRYEHLAIDDPVTKTIRHQVRGRDGKILWPYDLGSEYDKFKDAELVDIGKKLPFYNEYMAGHDHLTTSSENRVRVQISVFDHFLPSFGNIGAFRGLWKDIGLEVNHQALFSDFNWGKEQLSLSINFGRLLPLILLLLT